MNKLHNIRFSVPFVLLGLVVDLPYSGCQLSRIY